MSAKQRAARPPLTLTSLRQLQALAHPLRYRAFELLLDVPRTGKQLAGMLRKQPTHLYHHLRVLERAGIVRRVATRKNRGTTEKYFQAVSDRVVVDPELFGAKAATRHALVGQLLRTTLEELVDAAAVAEGEPARGPVLLKRLRIRTTARRIGALTRRLEQWLSDFEQAADDRGDQEFAVTVAFYPTKTAGAGGSTATQNA